MVVASQHHTVGFPDGYPAGCLQSLGCFVNEKGTEPVPCQQAVTAADECRGDDVGRVEQVGIDLYLQRCGPVAQAAHLAAQCLAPFVAAAACLS